MRKDDCAQVIEDADLHAIKSIVLNELDSGGYEGGALSGIGNKIEMAALRVRPTTD
jgi:hypothetical protein